jgi:hypothetical protein
MRVTLTDFIFPNGVPALLRRVFPYQLLPTVTGANTLYYVCRRRMLTQAFDWVTVAAQAHLVTTGYLFDPDHDTLADIPADQRLSVAPILKRSVNAHGWACSIGIEFENVQPAASGLPAGAVIFSEGGAETAPLIVCFNEVIELPVDPDGRSWYLYPNAAEAGDYTGSGGWWTP